MSFQVHQNTIPQGVDIQRRSATWPKEAEAACTNRNDSLLTKKNYNHFRYNKLPREVLATNCKGYVIHSGSLPSQKPVDMEQHILRPLWKGKKHN